MAIDKSEICKTYFKKIGKEVKIVKADGSEDNIFAVIGQLWQKNKSEFEELSSKIGRYYNDYYTYLGAYDIDITKFTDDDFIVDNDVKYYFVKADSVKVGNIVQYYTGILKKVNEESDNVFI
jgi:hypothetical protein